jgi:hypothetical protein
MKFNVLFGLVLVVGTLAAPFAAQAAVNTLGFEPKNPGSCTSQDPYGNGKCSAGGSY